MEKHVKTEMPRASELPAIGNQMTALSDVELQAVAGGLNPQPLPPRVGPHYE
jgi:hypothetical protein